MFAIIVRFFNMIDERLYMMRLDEVYTFRSSE